MSVCGRNDKRQSSLFLFHRATHSGNDAVLIVGSFFDAAKVWQAGHRNVVALVGSNLSDARTGSCIGSFGRRCRCWTAMPPASPQLKRSRSSWGRSVMRVDAIHLRPGAQLDQLAPRGINDMLSGHMRPVGGRER